MKLSEHFSTQEFTCKCGCGLCNVDAGLLELLESLRMKVDEPINIISGCRCKKHNKAVGGTAGSAHLTTEDKACEAADIRCGNMFNLLKEAFLIFERIGIRGTSLHVDVNKRSPYPRYWTYST